MPARQIGVALGLLLLTLNIPLGAHAQISATIGDTSPTTTEQFDAGANVFWLNIAGQYDTSCCGSIIIEPYSTSGSGRAPFARIETGVDGNQDKLSLTNAKIKLAGTTTAVINFPISFERQFTPDPPTASTFWYKYSATGSIRRGTLGTAPAAYNAPPTPPPYDQIRIRGHIDTGNGNWLQIASTELQHQVNTSTAASFNKYDQYPYPLGATRRLKGQFWFTMSNTRETNPAFFHVLHLQTGITVQSTTPGGPGEEDPPPESCMATSEPSGKPCKGPFIATTQSTLKAWGCSMCLTQDGLITPDKKVTMFAHVAAGSLRGDMAQGHGEHLAALAALLGIVPQKEPAFYTLAQDHFRLQSEQGVTSVERMIASLTQTLDSYPELKLVLAKR